MLFNIFLKIIRNRSFTVYISRLSYFFWLSLIQMMMMMMMNCCCGMVDRRKVFSLISSRDHCQRSSPSRISNTPWAGFEPEFRLSWMKLCSSDNHYTWRKLSHQPADKTLLRLWNKNFLKEIYRNIQIFAFKVLQECNGSRTSRNDAV